MNALLHQRILEISSTYRSTYFGGTLGIEPHHYLTKGLLTAYPHCRCAALCSFHPNYLDISETSAG